VAESGLILLAEDDPQDAELTLLALQRQDLAAEVVVVHDGEEALDFIFRRGAFAGRDEGHPLAVLLDLKMPKVDGVEVVRQLKAHPETRVIPLVVLTSSRESRDLDECYRLGVNAYVVKPVRFDDFMAAVQKLGGFWALVNEPPPGSRVRAGAR
jgi:CheY-like chemotaxis protein